MTSLAKPFSGVTRVFKKHSGKLIIGGIVIVILGLFIEKPVVSIIGGLAAVGGIIGKFTGPKLV